jgi:broad specificity phosphatase PhoE
MAIDCAKTLNFNFRQIVLVGWLDNYCPEAGKVVSSHRLGLSTTDQPFALVSIPKMSKIYLTRHGERLDFVQPDWQKTAKNPHDAPLTSRGEEQARRLGEHLADCNIAHVFVSPFSRACCTADRASAKLNPPRPVKIEPGACEWLNADWYGKHPPSWRALDCLAKEFLNVDVSYQPVFHHDSNMTRYPEKPTDVLERASATLRKITELFGDDGNILIVGHGSSVEAFCKILDSSSDPKNISCKDLSNNKHHPTIVI